jgi:hypothetical protein
MTSPEKLVAALAELATAERTEETDRQILADASDWIREAIAAQAEPSEDEERERGHTIAAILQLKQINSPEWDAPRYHTEWGSKTAVGLARTLGAILTGALPR